MPSVFVSYRRNDAVDITCHLFDRLQQSLGRDTVYIDQDTVPPGVDFHAHIKSALTECQIFLVVIGPQWLTMADTKGRRLDNPDDWVRVEVAAALAKHAVRVIPVLVGGSHMPHKQDLPEPLAQLSQRNSLTIRSGFVDSIADMTRLCAAVENVLKENEAMRVAEARRREDELAAAAERRTLRRTVLVIAGGLIGVGGCTAITCMKQPAPTPTAPLPEYRASDSPYIRWARPELAVLGGLSEPGLRAEERRLQLLPYQAVLGGTMPEHLPPMPFYPLPGALLIRVPDR